MQYRLHILRHKYMFEFDLSKSVQSHIHSLGSQYWCNSCILGRQHRLQMRHTRYIEDFRKYYSRIRLYIHTSHLYGLRHRMDMIQGFLVNLRIG